MYLAANLDRTQENFYALKLEHAYYSKWTFSKLAFICSSPSNKLHHTTDVDDIIKSKHIS